MVFPNPAKGKINLKLKNTSGRVYEVQMLDLIGKVIYNQSFQSENIGKGISIDITMCQSGTYILKVISEDKSYLKKVIVW